MKTVSLELAKQLQEAGIEIESQFSWYWMEHYQGEQEPAIEEFVYDSELVENLESAHWLYPAPTTDELLEWLPMGVRLGKDSDNPNWYWVSIINEPNAYQDADTPANALAKLCLWVAETTPQASEANQDELRGKEK